MDKLAPLYRLLFAIALGAGVNLINICSASLAQAAPSCSAVLLGQRPDWTRDPKLFEDVQSSWAECCSNITSTHPPVYRFLVHALDVNHLTPNDVVAMVKGPSRKSTSLTYVSETNSNTFFDLGVGLIFKVPPQNIHASSEVDFAANSREDLGALYSRSVGIHSPSKLLSESGPYTWNEVLVARTLDKNGKTSRIIPEGIFLRRSANATEIHFSAQLSELMGLPIVHIN